jgi:hypothetical protein
MPPDIARWALASADTPRAPENSNHGAVAEAVDLPCEGLAPEQAHDAHLG